MQLSQIPAKFNIPFANNAGGSFVNPIPQASQTSITPGAASLFDGFPPLNFQPIASGGVPPFGKDMNGILNQATAWDRWVGAGGAIQYDPTFQAAVGGYPQWSVVQSLIVPSNFWVSTVDNNTTNPDAGGAGWISDPGRMGTGDWKSRPDSTAQPGFVISNGTTIGSASSGATQLASATAQLLYIYLWNTYSNTQCPVTGGRGSNALADFNANKPIATLNRQAIGEMAVDGMGGTATGLLANVPVVSGSVTVAGSVIGENLHKLIAAEIPNITSNVSASSSSQFVLASSNFAVSSGSAALVWTTASGSALVSVSGTANSNNTGAGNHNNVMQSILVYWFHKL